MNTNITPGARYVLETDPGSRIVVEAQTEAETNSCGIEVFAATLLEDFGHKEVGDRHLVQTHIFDIIAEVNQ